MQIFQVKGGKFVKETEWFRAYPGGRRSGGQEGGVADSTRPASPAESPALLGRMPP